MEKSIHITNGDETFWQEAALQFPVLKQYPVHFHTSRCPEGYELTVVPGRDKNHLSFDVSLDFDKNSSRNRAVFETAEIISRMAESGDFPEEPVHASGRCAFQELGVMLDMARNGAMNLPSLKRMIRILAFLGYTYVGLYLEDLIRIPDEPYFGYMRGAYSAEEIRELDSYAEVFGVELRPFIQTLAHLNQITRYACYREAIDTDDILLAGNERTRQLLTRLIHTVSATFRSRTVNIGMDEAHMVGLGKYLDQHGYQDRTQILLSHLEMVRDLCREEGLHIQMWSDMFFRLAFHGEYYNIQNPEELKKISVPEDVDLVYWDYYHTDETYYDRMLRLHKMITPHVAYAAGAWKWGGFAPRCAFSLIQGKASMKACIRNGIQDFCITAWGDDGAEASPFCVLPVFFEDAALAYGQEDRRGFELFAGIPLEAFLVLDEANPYARDGITYSTSCKFLLYNDPLQGAFDSLVESDTAERFARAEKHIRKAGKYSSFSYIFETLADLCGVLSIKADLGVRIRSAYERTKNAAEEAEGFQMLTFIAERDIPLLLKKLDGFYRALKTQWITDNKTFGFEVQTIRIGGLRQRLLDLQECLLAYVREEISEIPELEEKLLPFGCSYENEEADLTNLCYNGWINMATTARIGF